jgi:hypothetical protein
VVQHMYRLKGIGSAKAETRRSTHMDCVPEQAESDVLLPFLFPEKRARNGPRRQTESVFFREVDFFILFASRGYERIGNGAEGWMERKKDLSHEKAPRAQKCGNRTRKIKRIISRRTRRETLKITIM